ncbi:recombination directionality factor [Iodobacter ciconiae]|uniref:Hydrolase or metal-binding protein n=1 Tax=Iodobacter ciconiae TaxID=2496266 RepID=A0A3S8ZPV1_9NEIS|nr:hypothetical protein [Iodobacter ciconiae]AZN35495.1 hypothetical protein EJO50_02720 [Iodobacter ciconiae]
MIKGLAITPPVIGRISIGKLIKKNDKLIPEKDDSFTLTTQVQNRDGWMLHPLHQQYADSSHNGKIRMIPVRVLFNDSNLNLRAEFSAFDRTTGRPLCVGDGEKAKRVSGEGIDEVACLTPERCAFAQEKGCKLFGRLNVQIEGQNDELGSFVFRTTGYNSVRTLAARLKYFEAVSGGNTRHLPLLLRLRAKSTTQSYRTPVFYVDLTLREEDSLAEAVCFARSEAIRYQEAGVETAQLEAAARQLLQNGQFEDGEEEMPLVLEEFYPEAETSEATLAVDQAPKLPTPKPTQLVRPARLTQKLGTANKPESKAA